MRNTIVAAALALAAGFAMSAPVAHSHSGDWVRLSDDPCPAEIADKAPPEAKEVLHAASTWIADKPYQACWVYLPGQGAVWLLYSDGDQGLLDAKSFKDEPAM